MSETDPVREVRRREPAAATEGSGMTLHESRYPRIPYGLANFRRIRMERRLYVDKTRFLHALEQANHAVLIRPRRLGKMAGRWRSAKRSATAGVERPRGMSGMTQPHYAHKRAQTGRQL